MPVVDDREIGRDGEPDPDAGEAAGPTADADDVYSPVLDGWTVPARYQPIQQTQQGPYAPQFAAEWDPPNPAGSSAARADYYGQQVRSLLDQPEPDLLVIDQTFHTPSNDPVFLEPGSMISTQSEARETT